MSNILSVQTHNIRNIDSWFFILVAKISSKKVYEKMENNATMEKALLFCNRKADLLRLVGATFDSKVVSIRWIRMKNLIILKSLPFFVLFVCRC